MVCTCLAGVGVAGGRVIRGIKHCHIHVVCLWLSRMTVQEQGDEDVFNLSQSCIVAGAGVRDVGQGKEWEGRSI